MHLRSAIGLGVALWSAATFTRNLRAESYAEPVTDMRAYTEQACRNEFRRLSGIEDDSTVVEGVAGSGVVFEVRRIPGAKAYVPPYQRDIRIRINGSVAPSVDVRFDPSGRYLFVGTPGEGLVRTFDLGEGVQSSAFSVRPNAGISGIYDAQGMHAVNHGALIADRFSNVADFTQQGRVSVAMPVNRMVGTYSLGDGVANDPSFLVHAVSPNLLISSTHTSVETEYPGLPRMKTGYDTPTLWSRDDVYRARGTLRLDNSLLLSSVDISPAEDAYAIRGTTGKGGVLYLGGLTSRGFDEPMILHSPNEDVFEEPFVGAKLTTDGAVVFQKGNTVYGLNWQRLKQNEGPGMRALPGASSRPASQALRLTESRDPVPLFVSQDRIRSYASDRSGSRLAIETENAILLVDARRGQVVATMEHSRPHLGQGQKIVLSPDGRHLVITKGETTKPANADDSDLYQVRVLDLNGV